MEHQQSGLAMPPFTSSEGISAVVYSQIEVSMSAVPAVGGSSDRTRCRADTALQGLATFDLRFARNKLGLVVEAPQQPLQALGSWLGSASLVDRRSRPYEGVATRRHYIRG